LGEADDSEYLAVIEELEKVLGTKAKKAVHQRRESSRSRKDSVTSTGSSTFGLSTKKVICLHFFKKF